MDNRRRMMLAGGKVAPLVVYKPGDAQSAVNALGASWNINWYSYSFGASYLQLQQKYNDTANGVAIVGPFDFTKYKKLIIDFIGKSYGNSSTEKTQVGYLKGSSYSSADSVDSQDISFASLNGINKHVEFDISNQSGNKWICFKYLKMRSTNTTQITNITLE